MSLRLRLTLWYVMVLALTLIGLGLVLRWRIESTLLEGLDRELASRAQRPIPRPNDRPPPKSIIPVFYNRNGLSLLGSRPVPDPEALQAVLQNGQPLARTRNDQRTYTSLVKTPSAFDAPLVFQASASLAPLHLQIAARTRELLTLLPLALLVAAGGGFFLTERALRPLRQLTQAAEQIGASDLSRRLETHGNDELAQLTQTFNGMLGRLETAFERQRQFVADASHELKTPLTAIKINTDLALDDTALSSETQARLVRVRHATDRTIRLTQNLLLLARGDAESLSLTKEDFSPRVLLEEVVETAKSLSPQGAELVVQVEVETLQGDPDYLFQLLLNLVENALRHTPKEGTVEIRGTREGFTVTDTGVGVTAEHLPHLTKRFYRVDTARARKAGGTGLGLAICQVIVEAHGGKLEIQSAPNEGTRVTVSLPVASS